MSDVKNECWSVYMLTPPNGKIYIGATKTLPRKRWNYGYGYRDNKELFDDIQKFGWKAFLRSVISTELTQEQAYRMEAELIKKHHANDPIYGYNKAAGGIGTTGFYPNEKTREKMSTSQKGKRNHRLKTFQMNKSGDIVAEYSSAREASQKTGINYKSIVNCCSGATPQAGGYYWKH